MTQKTYELANSIFAKIEDEKRQQSAIIQMMESLKEKDGNFITRELEVSLSNFLNRDVITPIIQSFKTFMILELEKALKESQKRQYELQFSFDIL